MTKTDVIQFLNCIGLPSSSCLISGGSWVRGPCPLSPWLHDKGKDSHPSFAIKINDQGESVFNCFTCKHGDLLYLLQLLKEFKVERPKYKLKEALVLLEREAAGALALNIKEDIGDKTEEDERDVVWPEEWLDSFVSALFNVHAVEYLYDRGVDTKAAQSLDLRFDSEKGTVCFPIRNWEGELVGLRGRYIEPGDGPKYHMYKYRNAYNRLPWYGEHLLDTEKPVLLVESVFDYASVVRVYPNVLAPLSVGMSKKKVQRIAQALNIVTLFDYGAGGNKARDTIDKYLPDSMIVHKIPETGDPGDMTEYGVLNILHDSLPIALPIVWGMMSPA